VVRKLGGGNWRVATDLVDHTVQRIENRILDETRPLPENIVAFATKILRNLLRKRPPLKLRRNGIQPLTEGVEIVAPDPLEVACNQACTKPVPPAPLEPGVPVYFYACDC
jgi:hypothetical protein